MSASKKPPHTHCNTGDGEDEGDAATRNVEVRTSSTLDAAPTEARKHVTSNGTPPCEQPAAAAASRKKPKKRKSEAQSLVLDFATPCYDDAENAFRPKSGKRSRTRMATEEEHKAANEALERAVFMKNFKGKARNLKPSQVAFKDERPLMGTYDEFAELFGDTVVVKERPDEMGNSVFAACDLKKLDIVAAYGGTIVEYDEDDECDYTLALAANSKWMVHAEPGETDARCLGLYVNDCFGVGNFLGHRAWQNAEYTFYGKLVDGLPKIIPVVRALCDIQEGEEIFCVYGKRYWESSLETRVVHRKVLREWAKPADERDYLRHMYWCKETGKLGYR